MNQVTLVGRLVREVEAVSVGTDSKVVNNSLAIARRHRDRNGERGADFIPIVAWNHLADILTKYCQKGRQVAIIGRLQSRAYQNKQDLTVYAIECIVEEITLLDYRQNQSNENNLISSKSNDSLEEHPTTAEQLKETVERMVLEQS